MRLRHLEKVVHDTAEIIKDFRELHSDDQGNFSHDHGSHRDGPCPGCTHEAVARVLTATSQQSEVPTDLREFIGDAIDTALEIEGATFSEVRRIANDCIDAEIEAQASRDADARAEE